MKNIFFTGLLVFFFLDCRSQVSGWQHKDLKTDGVFGISTDKAYSKLLRNKKAKTVIVTVIDSGIDTLHEDLKPFIWHNKNEIPENGIDDDRNGYVDDIIGWNFTGLSMKRDSLVKLIQSRGAYYDSLSYTKVPDSERSGYERFNKLKKEFRNISDKLKLNYANAENNEKAVNSLVKATGKANPSIQDFKLLLTKDSTQKKIVMQLINMLPLFKDYQNFKLEAIDRVLRNLKYAVGHLESGADSAQVIASLTDNNKDSSYDRMFTLPNKNSFYDQQPLTFHGTHIAGIIAADRSNHIGINGIADHVKIMSLKVYSGLFPGLREETLAKAIRYAVDNGSQIINLSLVFYSVSDNKVLEDAIRYAMHKNVLIIHGAGNEGKNIDDMPGKGLYPNKFYDDGTQADAWLTVGASSWKDNDSLAAHFSNYSEASVDLFAPGAKITSTIPGNRYQQFSGTSMATPMVVGVAALIMEYYPKLTAVQVKEIIMRSVEKVNHEVFLPGNSAVKTKVPFSSLCVSGGIVNAYKALKLAGTY